MTGYRLIAAALLAFALAIVPHSGDARSILADRHEATEIGPGFEAYLTDLRSAIGQQDVATLIALSTPEVKLSFGGDAGPDGLRRIFGGEDPEVWRILSETLDAGFSWDGEMAVAPHWFTAETPARFDPFQTWFVDASDVLLRAGPDRNATPVGSASHEFVQSAEIAQAGDAGYVKVEKADGRSGFMARRFLRPLVDYRAGFVQVDGVWKMVFFIAGD